MKTKLNSNDRLIDYLKDQGKVRSERVEAAFRNVDRRDFIPKSYKELAYADRPLPLDGVTISAPHMVAEVTELLEVKRGDKILEIGSGSGYQTAILGELADHVVGVEIMEELVEDSRKKTGSNVEIRFGNGFDSVEEKFDKILFSCAAENFDKALKYIEDDGVIVGPVRREDEQILLKWKSGSISEHGKVRYVEMQD